MISYRLLWGILFFFFSSCVSPQGTQDNQLGFEIFSLTASGPQKGLPETADTLRFVAFQNDDIIKDFSLSIIGLSDLDGDGPDDKEISFSIPANKTVGIFVQALEGGQLLASASADGIRVGPGRRRFIKLLFSPVKTATMLSEGLPSGIFWHGASRIKTDGRVLITGGFASSITAICPDSLVHADVCFRLKATRKAYLVDPSEGKVYRTRSDMLRPRALHTSTALGDGRVLIAGGLEDAWLGLRKIEGKDGNFELWPEIIPLSPLKENSTPRTFELFDPFVNREASDPGRDGDPPAGGFVGSSADELQPGLMNTPRYLHAASCLVESEEDVLVVGGQGSEEATLTAEIFRLKKPGGYGFSFPPTMFANDALPRRWPEVVTTSNSVVVISGIIRYPGQSPLQPEQLVERWVPSSDSLTGQFSDLGDWPGWNVIDRPENTLFGASATLFGSNEKRILVTGWLGPLCKDSGGPLPANQHDYSGTIACERQTYSTRNFAIGTELPNFFSVESSEIGHFLGTAVSLPSGQALVAGGLSNGSLLATNRIDIYSGDFVSGGGTIFLEQYSANLHRERAMHTATTLFGGRVLLVGGMYFDINAGDIPESVRLVSTVEIFDSGWEP